MKLHRILIAIGGILFLFNSGVMAVIFVTTQAPFSGLSEIERGLGVGASLLLLGVLVRGSEQLKG